MNRILKEADENTFGSLILCYVDDILIATATAEEHIKRLREVFGLLRKAGLKLKATKCKLMTAETKFLGRIVTREGIKPNPDAIKKVQSWQAPRCKKELESFLGFAKYYREFIKDYASFASPLAKLRSKYSTWEWTEETQNAFQILKDKLCSEPILALPCDDRHPGHRCQQCGHFRNIAAVASHRWKTKTTSVILRQSRTTRS